MAWADTSAKASAAGVPYWDLAQRLSGPELEAAINERVSGQGSQQDPLWEPFQGDPNYSWENADGTPKVPYSNYFTTPAGQPTGAQAPGSPSIQMPMPVTAVSAQMQEAYQKGDPQAYDTARKEYQRLTGTVPDWSRDVTPAMVQANAPHQNDPLNTPYAGPTQGPTPFTYGGASQPGQGDIGRSVGTGGSESSAGSGGVLRERPTTPGPPGGPQLPATPGPRGVPITPPRLTPTAPPRGVNPPATPGTPPTTTTPPRVTPPVTTPPQRPPVGSGPTTSTPPAAVPPRVPPVNVTPPTGGLTPPSEGNVPPQPPRTTITGTPGQRTTNPGPGYNAFQGGASRPTGGVAAGYAAYPFSYKSGSDPADILANDRGYAYQVGNSLIDNYSQMGDQANQRARVLGDLGDSYFSDLLANPGYDAADEDAIKNQGQLAGMRFTPEQAQANMLTAGERGDIAGDPYMGQRTFDAAAPGVASAAAHYGDTLKGIYDSGSTDINTANARQSQALSDSIDAKRLNVSQDHLNSVNDTLSTEEASAGEAVDPSKLSVSGGYDPAIASTLADEQGAASDAIDPSRLGLSGAFNDRYNFTAGDEEEMVNAAGRSAGIGALAQREDIQRRAAAEGNVSALGLAAAQNRADQTGLVASADAMTNARIQAKQLGLSTAGTKEGMRLGAEQDLSGRQYQSAMDQGQQRLNQTNAGEQLRLGAQQNLSGMQYRSAMDQGQQRLTQANAQEQQRLGAEQDISSRKMQAATTVGNQNQANQQFLTQGRAQAGLQTGQTYVDTLANNAAMTAQLAGQGEAQGALRAQALAQNRQQTNQANQTAAFERDRYTDQASSQRATQVADTARADQTTARSDLRAGENQAYNNQNSQQAATLQAFSGVTGAGAASQQNAIRAAQIPSTTDKLIAAAVGGAAGAGGNMAKGGVVTRPTVARIGEQGPEMVVPLDSQPNARRYANDLDYPRYPRKGPTGADSIGLDYAGTDSAQVKPGSPSLPSPGPSPTVGTGQPTRTPQADSTAQFPPGAVPMPEVAPELTPPNTGSSWDTLGQPPTISTWWGGTPGQASPPTAAPPNMSTSWGGGGEEPKDWSYEDFWWDDPESEAMASGGVATRPTLARIGERGPEAVVKLNPMQYRRKGEMAYA